MNLLRVALVALFVTFAASGCTQPTTGTSSQPQTFKIGIVPYESATELKDEYAPFTAYMSKKLGKPVEIFVAQDYSGVCQALSAGQIDLAYLNPLSYALYTDKLKDTPRHLIPISMPVIHKSLYYYGAIFVRKDSGINTIADLKGKKMAFSDATSTSGYLYPTEYLNAHGINPKKDFPVIFFAGSQSVVPSVLNKSTDVGAVFESALTHGLTPAQQTQLKVLARVGPIANGMIVARGDLDPSLVKQAAQAYVDVNTDPDGIAALKKLDVDKYEKPDDSIFNPVRVAAKELGMDITVLAKKKK